MARKTKQQAQATRQHILDAAIREFSAKGVSNTSLNDIAIAAGVTRGAIYWHFKNKSDLFNEVWTKTESKISELELQYQAKFPNDPLRVLREILIYILIALVKDPRRRALLEIIFHKCEFVGEMEALIVARKALYLEGNSRVESVLKVCIAHHQLPESLDVRIAAILLRAYMTGIMENWLFMPENFDLESDAERLVDISLDMLRNNPYLRVSHTE